MLWYQNEIRKSRALFSFLNANSVKRVAIDFLCSDIEKHPKDHFRTNISYQQCFFKESYTIGLTQRASSLAKVGFMASTSTRGLPRLSLVFWDVSIFPNFLIRGLTILGLRRVCRIVLSLVGKGRGLILKIPVWHWELGHGGVGKAITLGETLISSRIAPSGPWPNADVFLEKIDWSRALAQSWTSTY